MAEHLRQIISRAAVDAHAVLVCDGAARHQPRGRLPMPNNISLLEQSGYAFELNSIKNV
jgi:hypothetical protein